MTTLTLQNKEALRAFVHRSHEGIYRDAVIDAQNLAEADAGADLVRNSEMGIVHRYEGIVAHVRQIYQSHTEQAHDRFDAEHEDANKTERDANLSEAKNAKRIAEAERRRYHVTYDWPTYWGIAVLEILGFLAETAYNTLSLSVGGGSLLLSMAPALVVAISLCAFAVYLGTRLRDAHPNEKTALIRRFGGWLLIVFVALATLRSFAVMSEGSILFSYETLIGAIAFIVIQALIFGGAVIIAMHLPSKEDRAAKSEYDRLSRDIQKSDAIIAECQRDAEHASQSAHARRKSRIDLVGEQSHLEALVANLCRQTLSAFCRELALRKPSMNFSSSIGSMPLFQNK
jgi:hypothetical protein